ncbi:MAG TPA: CBS domain-containing protein [Burkholderiaceae bacterium]|nr:CBS domain-containing protein [Burkholderiaceae bacterium]HRA77518.1 CBS domain-containing protein [Burkholderiaceae bacterium]
MNDDSTRQRPSGDPDGVPDLELSDEDILDALKRIPGYVDITTEDFREVYHLAHRHAIDRLVGQLRASSLMRVDLTPLRPDMPMDEAARTIVRIGYKALPVVDADGRVIGMLTETDFLRRLQVDTFLELLLRLLDDAGPMKHRCHETTVREAMTAPVVSVRPQARFGDLVTAFRSHPGRSMPVVDEDGRLRGLLLRKDFLGAFEWGDLL